MKMFIVRQSPFNSHEDKFGDFGEVPLIRLGFAYVGKYERHTK